MEKKFENNGFKAIVSRFKSKSTGKIFFKVRCNIYELLNDKKYEDFKDHLNNYNKITTIRVNGQYVYEFDDDEKWFKLVFDYIYLHYKNLEHDREVSKIKGKIIRRWLSNKHHGKHIF